MIHEVDDSLRSVIERIVVNGADIDVAFDAPTKDWATRQTKPTISAFLYDIREDVGRRDVAPREIKDEAGRIVGREAPPRRFRLSYLLTAWTQRPEDEHRLLSQLLAAFLTFDQIPGGEDGYLVGSLADAWVPTLVTLALPPPQDRSLSDVWSALGGELKPSLDLVVTAPIDPGRNYETGPPVLERPRLSVGGVEMDPEDVDVERRRRQGRAFRAPAEDVPERPGAHRRQVGDDEFPGRTFVISTKVDR